MLQNVGEEECQEHGDSIDREVEQQHPQQESESEVLSNASIHMLCNSYLFAYYWALET